jgi:ketosteroid isomerase-like protein
MKRDAADKFGYTSGSVGVFMPVSVDETEVLSRNRAFYAAFAQRDLVRMDDLWAKEAAVACVHPGWQPIRGRPQVMASWRAILAQENSPHIKCEGATASIVGETAIVLCEELLDDGRLVATNLFVREEGEWRICHHQAGPMAQPLRGRAGLDELEADDSDDFDEVSDDDDDSDGMPTAPGRKSRLLN